MQKERFKIETEQAVLDDLRERLHRTRFAPDLPTTIGVTAPISPI
jgi:hypothetical protein